MKNVSHLLPNNGSVALVNTNSFKNIGVSIFLRNIGVLALVLATMLAHVLAHVLVAMLAWARAKARRHVTAAPTNIHGGGVFKRNALTESACLFLILNDDRFII